MILLVHHIAKMSLRCEVISSFVIFAVLDLRVCGCPWKQWKGVVNSKFFFTIIFAVFLYDLTSSCQISSKRDQTAHLWRHIDFSRWRPQKRKSTSGFLTPPVPFDLLLNFYRWCPSWSICVPNFKFLAWTVPDIWRGSQNSKSRSREPCLTPFDLLFNFCR